MSQTAAAATIVRHHEIQFTARRVSDGPECVFTVVLEQTLAQSTDADDQGRTAQEWIRRTLHGQVLDAVLGASPSAENLALHLYSGCADFVPALTAVQVSPEPGSWVTYRPDGR
ncbi:6-carboxytetrahydropterin synthase [Streptomyces sp. PSKA30]|uniref:6-carboxytetrahydropterin synthase n=1 Tax=Streptomyces sp. PSKA30 TaxID=2874597 RepID=UPI001CD16304|nr:6-carboxytetrahydropterin synthase [Streptomyces sp. PSKA30]MBZ9644500.1 6-carboxytetrahydropterin synthase [Streptomyces sp. PSKA30]